MYQHELIGIMNANMLQAIRFRGQVEQETEQYGYWHGVYKAYDDMIRLLMMTDIKRQDPDAPVIAPIP